MMRTYLGEFEEIVLLTVASLEGRAYGVVITHCILEQTACSVRLNQVHAALQLLEEKAMLSSQMGAATPERGGRRKRFFQLTAYGQRTLLDIQAVCSHRWNFLPQLLKPSL
jgi:PadR family transcriptional regulator PadR